MADNHTPEVRSYNMSRIRSKDTRPEEKVRKYLFSKGYRYRKNVKALPGSPDIVLKKFRTVIFVHGCFWHMHDCGRFRWPSINEEYWHQKINRNVERDLQNRLRLEAEGWNVIILWECAIMKKEFSETMRKIIGILENHNAC